MKFILHRKYLVYLAVGLGTFGITFAALTFIHPRISNKELSSLLPNNLSISSRGLKTCGDVTQANTQEPETSLNAKYILRITDQTGKKETFKVVDFNTKRESIIKAQSPFTDDRFSPDGKYLIYKQRFEGKNNQDIIKFFLFNTNAETTTEIVPSFSVGYIDPHRIMWSDDSKQFIIWQTDEKTRKPEKAQANYFDIDDLKPHDLKNLIMASAKQNMAPYRFSNQNELVFYAFKQDGETVEHEFAKANLTNSSLNTYKSFSLKVVGGVFTPDLKYYVFVEKESLPSGDFQKFQEGASEKELEEATKKIQTKELKAYIGYVNVEERCMKKIEIAEVPIYYGSTINIEQISEDSKKVLLKINSLDITNNVEIVQYWRVDIATLKKAEKGLKTTIDGDQMNSITKMSPLFNHAIVHTVKGKSYFMNLRTGKTELITTGTSEAALYDTWLKEVPK